MNQVELSEVVEIISRAAEQAFTGTLGDEMRVRLYRVALTAAAEEFYRIEQVRPGSVEPAVLLVLQQLTMICDDNPDPAKIIGAAGALEEKNGGGSLADASEVRTTEFGSPSGDS